MRRFELWYSGRRIGCGVQWPNGIGTIRYDGPDSEAFNLELEPFVRASGNHLNWLDPQGASAELPSREALETRFTGYQDALHKLAQSLLPDFPILVGRDVTESVDRAIELIGTLKRYRDDLLATRKRPQESIRARVFELRNSGGPQCAPQAETRVLLECLITALDERLGRSP